MTPNEQKTVEAVTSTLVGEMKYVCDNCDWEGTNDEGDLDNIDDVWDRLEAGDIVPAGQCPECSGLVHLRDEDLPDWLIKFMASVLVQRGWTLGAP